MQAAGDKPLVVAGICDVNLGSIVGEVSQDDTDIDCASKETSAETSNASGRDFGDVNRAMDSSLVNGKTIQPQGRFFSTEIRDGRGLGISTPRRDELRIKKFQRCNLPHDRGLAHAKTCNESPRIDCAKITVDASDHEDDNADYPEDTEEPSGHDTANAITDKEGAIVLNISQCEQQNSYPRGDTPYTLRNACSRSRGQDATVAVHFI